MASGVVRKRVRARRNGEVTVTWFVDYYDQHGQRHYKTFHTKRAADAWLTDTRSDLKAGLHVPDRNSITVAEAVRLWLERRELRGAERGSLRTYGQYARLYIVPLLGTRKLSSLTSPAVEAFYDALLKGDLERRRPAASKHRAKAVLWTLKTILADMQRRQLVGQNVALPVKIEDNKRDERPVEIGVDVPSKAEVNTILQHAEGKVRTRLLVALLTGVRSSELRALTWSSVDFAANALHVRSRADWWGTIGAPKSKHGYRDIPMVPMLVNALKEWRLACPRTELDLVFPGRAGAVLNPTGLNHSFHAAQRLAGVVDEQGEPKYGMHSLRHFFASLGIEQGFSPKRLQTLLGHGSIKMTYDIYGHLFPSPEDDQARLAAGTRFLLGAP